MTVRRNRTLATVALLLCMGQPMLVRAYDPETHSKIVSSAVHAMQQTGLSVPAPTGIDRPPTQAEFNDYLTKVSAAPATLGALGTGLPKKVPFTKSSQGLFPFAGDSPISYPFNEVYSNDGPPDPDTGEPTSVPHAPPCPTYKDDDLSDVSRFRISEFRYIPKGWTGSACGISQVGSDMSPDAPPEVLEQILGWHAASVDFHINDSVLWFKPTNASGASAVKDIAREVVSKVIGTVVVPFYCASQWLQGKSCNLHKPYQLADSVNPVDFIDGFVPGYGDIRGDDYTGLWHFIHVDTGRGDYNNFPGMYYPHAGPDGAAPGVMDVVIILMADTLGLSLNAYSSDGDDIYGDEDDVNRFGPAPWMAYSIAHVEFSSLDNLAKYGWKRWNRDGANTAEGLAWPLHAIGDASEPHHVAGSTSWGHRALEAGVNHRIARFFPADDDTQGLADRGARIISASYPWFRWLNEHNGDVESFIEQLALQTRAQVRSQGDWAYKDWSSVQEAVSDDSGRRYFVNDNQAGVQQLVDLSSAATIGFLTYASQHTNPLSTATPKCPPGTSFQIFRGCVQDSTNPTEWPLNGCQQWEPYCTTTGDCAGGTYTCDNHCCRPILQ